MSGGIDDSLLFIFDDAFDPEIFVRSIEVALSDYGFTNFKFCV